MTMNNGQQMFHDFFLKIVKEGKEAEAEALLAECFRKQAEGSFSKVYLMTRVPKFHALVRPECLEQLKQAMEHFASQL